MEGSESEAIFVKLKLKPQFFINESLNRVDELLDGAFDYFHHEASRLLKTDGNERSQDLRLGVNYIRSSVEVTLDKRLSMWERYCLHHCFSVPTGFSLPSERETSGDDTMDDVSNEQLDAQLDSLRSKLAEAGKERADLNRELQELERNSSMSKHCVSAVDEALQLYDNNSTQDMFQEILRVAAELQQKLDQLKTKQKKENDRIHKEGAHGAKGGLWNMKPNDLQEFIAEMNL